MSNSNLSLHCGLALLPNGWLQNVRLTVSGGIVRAIQVSVPPQPDDERHGAIISGMPNLHSHAFQRGMAGLAERRGPSADSFWSWRETMYRFMDRIGPEELTAIAALAYMEMIEAGFTRVGEFHYLHHDPNGERYLDPAEMSGAIVAAAEQTGIGLTLLPVFYAHSGFGGLPLAPGQRRFGCDLGQFARLLESARGHVARLPDAVVGIAPHSLRAVMPEELAELVTLAAGSPIHIHIAEQLREVEDCLQHLGARPVEWLLDHAPVDAGWCLVHATHMTDGETARLAATGAVAGLCPITEANLGDGLFPADIFLAADGQIGIGSDSNVLIDVAEELRLLEYGQRLIAGKRNVLSSQDCTSTGERLYRRTAHGGGVALGSGSSEIAVGKSADLVSLDLDHPAFYGRDAEYLLDSWIFAAGRPAIDCVWRRGTKAVSKGVHFARGPITERYRTVLEKMLA